MFLIQEGAQHKELNPIKNKKPLLGVEAAACLINYESYLETVICFVNVVLLAVRTTV